MLKWLKLQIQRNKIRDCSSAFRRQSFFFLCTDTDRCIKLICVLASELNVILYKAGNLGSEARWPKQLKLEL